MGASLDGTSSNRKVVVMATIRKPCMNATKLCNKNYSSQGSMEAQCSFSSELMPSLYLLPWNCFTFKIEIYIYHHREQLRVYLANPMWDKSQETVSSIHQSVPLQGATETVLSTLWKQNLIELYWFCTGDVSTTSVEEHVQQKLKFVLDSQDPEEHDYPFRISRMYVLLNHACSACVTISMG